MPSLLCLFAFQNHVSKPESPCFEPKAAWYDASQPTLFDLLDSVPPPLRKPDAPLRVTILDGCGERRALHSLHCAWRPANPLSATASLSNAALCRYKDSGVVALGKVEAGVLDSGTTVSANTQPARERGNDLQLSATSAGVRATAFVCVPSVSAHAQQEAH